MISEKLTSILVDRHDKLFFLLKMAEIYFECKSVQKSIYFLFPVATTISFFLFFFSC